MKIGVMFGNPETTTGGNALKFYSSVRLDVRRVGALKTGEEVTGNRTGVKVVKNKMAPPFTKVEFDLMYGEGISLEGDVLDLATTANLVEKSGAWFSVNGERMGQGRDQAKQFLKENPKITQELREKLLSKNGIGRLLMDKPEAGAEGSLEEVELEMAPPPMVAKAAKEAKEAKEEKSSKKAKH
jgi:recombination protein RecA